MIIQKSSTQLTKGDSEVEKKPKESDADLFMTKIGVNEYEEKEDDAREVLIESDNDEEEIELDRE